MTVVPQFGVGKPVAVRPIDDGGKKPIPTWVWYAGGAVVAIGFIMFLRRGSSGTSTGSPLSTAPTDSGGQLANLAAALQTLGASQPGASSSTSQWSRTTRQMGPNTFFSDPNAGNVLGYDKLNGGIGVYSDTTGGNPFEFLPFGSVLHIDPHPVHGFNNRGTDIWYQGVDTNGVPFFISAYDLQQQQATSK